VRHLVWAIVALHRSALVAGHPPLIGPLPFPEFVQAGGRKSPKSMVAAIDVKIAGGVYGAGDSYHDASDADPSASW